MCRRWLLVLGVGLLLGGDSPNEKVRVDQIIVVGNSCTRQSVILRQLPFKPGDAVNLADLQVAERNLARLDAFRGTPGVEFLPGNGEGVRTVLVTVEEADPRGVITLRTAAAKQAERDEKDRLRGRWKVVSAKSHDGDKDLEAVYAGALYIFRPEPILIVGEDTYPLSWRLDPTKGTKAIDLTNEAGDVVLGIYERDGDNLKIAWNEAAHRTKRPAAFPARQESGFMVLALKRESRDTRIPAGLLRPVRRVPPPPPAGSGPAPPADSRPYLPPTLIKSR